MLSHTASNGKLGKGLGMRLQKIVSITQSILNQQVFKVSQLCCVSLLLPCTCTHYSHQVDVGHSRQSNSSREVGSKEFAVQLRQKGTVYADSLRNCISPQYTCTILHRLLFCSKKVLIQTLHYPKCYAQKFEATMQLTCRKILSTMLCIQCGAIHSGTCGLDTQIITASGFKT